MKAKKKKVQNLYVLSINFSTGNYSERLIERTSLMSVLIKWLHVYEETLHIHQSCTVSTTAKKPDKRRKEMDNTVRMTKVTT